ncbi:hypothetical protein [Ottowia sp. VDI28]|uniref:hypothetical protein n=1 Tax=Ottowia sp. VDI28 TaxID=3133968 RepID=UPI003C2C0889
MATRALAALVLAIGLISGGYWWGHTATDNAWAARQAKADRKADEELAKANERADQAAAQYLNEHLDQEARYADLDAKYRELRSRHPLVVRRPDPVAPGPNQCASQGAVPPEVGVDRDPDRLTLAAVRMWNGALTGADAPASACGLAGAAEGADSACSEDSGLTLDDAWANHRANAKTCLEDRQRYRALIDLLKKRQSP